MQGTLNTGGIRALTLTFLGGQGCHVRLKQGLKANGGCDVTSLVPKCMFLEEFTLARTHTYMARTRRGRFGGSTKSEAALWASNPVHLGYKKPVPP